MTDDFERQLAVALKTAVHDLPAPASTATEALRMDPVAPVRPARRPRILLVTAVLLAIALVAGGAWWAVGRGTPTPPADAGTCTAGDLRVTRDAPTPRDFDVVTVVAVTARTACVVTAPPVLTLRGDAVPWQAADHAAWRATSLAADTSLRFALRVDSASRGPGCEGVTAAPESVDVGVGGDGPAVLSFDLAERVCRPATFTSYEPPYPATPDDTSAPCTAADLDVVPQDTGKAADGVGIEVVAVVGCGLDTPPAVTLDDAAVTYATSATPGDDQTPWLPTTLQRGDSVQFEVVPGPRTRVPCPGAVPYTDTVRAAVGGAQVTSFFWTSNSCVPSGFLLVPRSGTGTGAQACTADDVDVVQSAPDSPVIRVVSHDGASCRLVDPPTVLADDQVLSYRPTASLAGGVAWSSRPVGPDREVDLTLATFVASYPGCPAEPVFGPTATVDVRVLIGSARVLAFARPADGCGELTVITPG